MFIMDLDINDSQTFTMLEVYRTYRANIRNHSQVAEMFDHHGESASKL